MYYINKLKKSNQTLMELCSFYIDNEINEKS